MLRRPLLGALLASALLLPAALRAQDSVIVIDPSAPFADTTPAPGLPQAILEEAVATYNDSAATRIAGDLSVPPGTRLAGTVAVLGGSVRIAGTVQGDLVVINGTLTLLDGGEVTGGVLVVGGRLHRAPGAVIGGVPRVYWEAAPVLRDTDGRLTIRVRRRPLTQPGEAQARFGVGPVQATLGLGTGGTYNRIEGLPITFGPSLAWRPSADQTVRIDLRGIVRTVGTESNLRTDVGYQAELHWRSVAPQWGVRLLAHSRIAPMRSGQLSLAESGWSALLLQRDYHDYFEERGVGGELYGYPIRGLRVGVEVGRNRQATVQASDPLSLLRNRDRWRPNPPIDDGHFVTITGRVRYDSRNAADNPSTGWLADFEVSHAHSNDFAPVRLPAEVREPLPAGSYGFGRVWFDLRRYSRLTPSLRVNARLLGGGWLSGEPLPVQERLALGGPGLLPGYAFRDRTCAPAGSTDPGQTALCDRMLVAQLEVRAHVGLDPSRVIPGPVAAGITRLLGLAEADLVFLGDGGAAWLTGIGPGRVPNNRIPVPGEWLYDVGAGVDTGTLGLYLAKALTGHEPLRLIARLQHRF